ncbi:MAG: hypothetical protein AB7O38_19030, partial [Pirellulaceae bacterium]
MRRIASIACAAGVLLTGSVWADGGGFVSDRASARPTVVSFAHYPDCPGCRAFLTGMVRGGPGCNCTPCPPYGSSGSHGYGAGPS